MSLQQVLKFFTDTVRLEKLGNAGLVLAILLTVLTYLSPFFVLFAVARFLNWPFAKTALGTFGVLLVLGGVAMLFDLGRGTGAGIGLVMALLLIGGGLALAAFSFFR